MKHKRQKTGVESGLQLPALHVVNLVTTSAPTHTVPSLNVSDWSAHTTQGLGPGPNSATIAFNRLAVPAFSTDITNQLSFPGLKRKPSAPLSTSTGDGHSLSDLLRLSPSLLLDFSRSPAFSAFNTPSTRSRAGSLRLHDGCLELMPLPSGRSRTNTLERQQLQQRARQVQMVGEADTALMRTPEDLNTISRNQMVGYQEDIDWINHVNARFFLPSKQLNQQLPTKTFAQYRATQSPVGPVAVKLPPLARGAAKPEYCNTESDDEERRSQADSSRHRCEWIRCGHHAADLNSLVSHVHVEHVEPAPAVPDTFVCLWSNCRRSQKPFNARYKLVVHMRIHTGERPNRCDFPSCGRTFTRAENLRIHLRHHTGEKPYECQYTGCDRSFSNPSDRAKHLRTHVNEKPYACSLAGCPKRYTDPSSLRKHYKTHQLKAAQSRRRDVGVDLLCSGIGYGGGGSLTDRDWIGESLESPVFVTETDERTAVLPPIPAIEGVSYEPQSEVLIEALGPPILPISVPTAKEDQLHSCGIPAIKFESNECIDLLQDPAPQLPLSASIHRLSLKDGDRDELRTDVLNRSPSLTCL